MRFLLLGLSTVALLSAGCLTLLPILAPTVDVEDNISAAFPFESKFVDVLDSKMHYVEVGEGAPIVLVHGNPTSSYLWRNVIPHLAAPGRRIIALDLIGMGKSGKPNIAYKMEDQVRYFEGFLSALDLKDVTLVVHDWGGGIGLDHAMRHPDNIRAIAMMETLIRPPPKGSVTGSTKYLFDQMRGPDGVKLLIEDNYFIEKILPAFSGRTLSDAEMEAYRAPFLKPEHRKPIRAFAREAPLDDGIDDNHARISATYEKLKKTPVPLLLLTFEPGGIIPPELAETLAKDIPKMRVIEMGAGVHFVQETQPTHIGKALDGWLSALPTRADKTLGARR